MGLWIEPETASEYREHVLDATRWNPLDLRDQQRLSEAAVHRINELMRQSDLHGDMQRVREIITPLTLEVSPTC